MSKVVENFFNRNKYNPNIKFKIKTKEEINPILYFCCITGEREIKKVSVANILGFDYMCYNLENDLCKNMNYFFDEQGTGYQRRSIGMLEMNKDEFLDKMKRVCKEDTMCLIQCDNKKFVVSSNGLHRFNVLKIHYLSDLNNIDHLSFDAIKDLKKKYEFDMEVTRVDYVKTYSYFILHNLNADFTVKPIWDKDWNSTNQSEVIFKDKSRIFSDDELVVLVQEVVEMCKNNGLINVDFFNEYYNKVESFREFVGNNDLHLVDKGEKYEF